MTEIKWRRGSFCWINIDQLFPFYSICDSWYENQNDNKLNYGFHKWRPSNFNTCTTSHSKFLFNPEIFVVIAERLLWEWRKDYFHWYRILFSYSNIAFAGIDKFQIQQTTIFFFFIRITFAKLVCKLMTSSTLFEKGFGKKYLSMIFFSTLMPSSLTAWLYSIHSCDYLTTYSVK